MARETTPIQVKAPDQAVQRVGDIPHRRWSCGIRASSISSERVAAPGYPCGGGQPATRTLSRTELYSAERSQRKTVRAIDRGLVGRYVYPDIR